MPTNQSDLDNILMRLLPQVTRDCVELTIKAMPKGIHSFLVFSTEAFGTFLILIALRTCHLQNDSRGKPHRDDLQVLLIAAKLKPRDLLSVFACKFLSSL